MSIPALPERYTPLEKLGQGGMAEVWLVRDEVTGDQLAAKVLFEHLRQDGLIAQRFRREIVAARRFQSPHAIALYDLIETEDVLAILMEHHTGEDLKRLRRREKRLAPERAVRIAAQLLDALAAAHEAGVIHRDVKPQNVLIGEGDRVKLADFGLARVDDLISITTHTTTLGTVEYMAPEQIGAVVIDSRADLYAVGVILYELLTGKLPFKANTPMGLAREHRDAERPDPRAINPDIPAHIARAVRRAMARHPDDRFATAQELRDALEHPDAVDAGDGEDAHARCPECGARLVPDVPQCLECGYDPHARFERVQAGKHSVIIPAPLSQGLIFSRSRRRMLSQDQYATLRDYLLSAEPGLRIQGSRGFAGTRMQLLPVPVLRDVSEEDAAWIRDDLQHLGLPAEISGPSWRDRARFWINNIRAGVIPVLLFVLFISFMAMGAMGQEALREVFRMNRDMAEGIAVLLSGALNLSIGWALVRAKARSIMGLGEREGARAGEDAALRDELVALHEALRSPHSRAMVRRVAILHHRLRAAASTDPVLGDLLREELDALRAAAFAELRAIAHLEDALHDRSPGELYEAIQATDAMIAREEDAHELDALITRRVELEAQLDTLDAHHHELAERHQRVLDLSSQMERMAREIAQPHAGERDQAQEINRTLQGMRSPLDAAPRAARDEVVFDHEAARLRNSAQLAALPASARAGAYAEAHAEVDAEGFAPGQAPGA